ncbi:hypothetical protein YC2023_035952 [Brassica napus]
MEEGMTAQVFVGCRIIIPKSLFTSEKSFNSLDPCCFRISAGGKVGAAQLLQRGKEHVMMFNYSWKREGIQYKKNQVSAFFYSLFNGYDYLKVMKVQISGPEALQ